MQIIESLVREHAGGLAAQLSQASDLDAEQAGRFVPEAARDVGEALTRGGLDLGSLLGDDLGSLLSKLDVGALATRTGVSSGQASGALDALVPMVLRLLQQDSGGLAELASVLGGDDLGGDDLASTASGLLGKAGKLFGS